MRYVHICLFLCLIKLNCMSTKSKNTSDCIKDFIAAVEQKGTVFSALMQDYHAEGGENLFQFTAQQPASCLQSATFIKESGKDRLANVTLDLTQEVTVSELTEGFGEFRNAPPDPSGFESAIAKYRTANEQVRYALIIEQKGPINPETKVSRISLRLDHMD